ncbi:unnamed protein product [Cochlearia groenlandica]
MDEFGVLTERYGIKPQGKSAPMSASKRSVNANNGQSWSFGSGSGANSNSSNNVSRDDIFSSTSIFGINTKGSSVSSGFDDFDVFGVLNKSSSGNIKPSSTSSSSGQGFGVDDNLFGSKSLDNVNGDDIFGSFSSSAKQYSGVDDLFGEFGLKSNSSGKREAGFDELIPGFGSSVSRFVYNMSIAFSVFQFRIKSNTTTSNFAAASADPFVVLESTMSATHSSSGMFADPLEEFAASVSFQGKARTNTSQTSTKLKPPPKPTQKVDRVKSSGMSTIDELEDFAMGTMRRSASASDTASKYREAEDAGTKKKQFGVDDLDSFFNSGHRSSSVPKSRTTTETTSKQAFNVPKKTPNGVSSTKKPPAPTNLVDDFSALFGDDPVFKQFEEIPGESEERRKARWDREQRTKSRVAQAVADMNNRDHQSRIEQEQRTRISETVDSEIRRWAAGKEGNMRALLSSLQIVLWPGCGWEAVSLTDLITSSAVKKVYRKATLYVHPDKVQQKGATLEQKYIAEKVFDILKEAWNKFNKEELS